MSISPVEKPLLFISDAHLGGFSAKENARIEAELIQLINYCQRNSTRIAILGDLFDYWMEYPNYVPHVGKKMIDRFETFNRELGPTLFITGNHDNWTRDHLLNKGFKVKHEHEVLSLNGKEVMVMHGDGLSEYNKGLPRPSMHRLMRHPQFVTFYQSLFPPRTGLTIMKYFSRFTRWFEWEENKAEKLNQWAQKTLSSTNLNTIICGHDHIPRRKQFAFGSYINLGTFYKHRTMAYYEKGKISLVRWDPKLQSLKPFDNT